jgi:hypothetical protein
LTQGKSEEKLGSEDAQASKVKLVPESIHVVIIRGRNIGADGSPAAQKDCEDARP